MASFDVPGGSFAAEGITFDHQGDVAASVVVIWRGEVEVSDCRFTGGVPGEFGDFEIWPLWMGAGLALDANSAGTVERCNAVENDVGVALMADEVTLIDNELTDNFWGLLYLGRAGGLARGNDCSRNMDGIAVFQSASPTLEENICSDNMEAGIVFVGETAGTARQNECSRNGLHGIWVEDDARPTLEDNTCADNEFNGIFYGDSAA